MSKVFDVEVDDSNSNAGGLLCGVYAYVAMLFKDEGFSPIEIFALQKAMLDIEPFLDADDMSSIDEIIKDLYESTETGSVDEIIDAINNPPKAE